MAKEVVERRLTACAIYLCSRITPLIAGSASCKIIQNIEIKTNTQQGVLPGRAAAEMEGWGTNPFRCPRASLKQAEFRSKREPEEFSCEPSAVGSLYIY